MRHKYFEIRNFKGIEHIKLELDSKPKSNIYTLVGLNESGKTTILEAIDFFESRVLTVDRLNVHGYSAISDVHKLIPVAQRSNFNGEISIAACYTIDPDDKELIKDYVRKQFGIELTRQLQDDLIVTKRYKFSRSEVVDKGPATIFNIVFWGKAKRWKKEKSLPDEMWQEIVTFIKTLMPSVLYFPNLLFEFPDRIYLENPPKSEATKHQFYRDVLEDVLRATDKDASIEDHIIARIKNPSYFDGWLRESLESTLSKMGSHISRTVFEQWNKILKSDAKHGAKQKEITLTAQKESVSVAGGGSGEEPTERVYIQLRLKEGSEYYSIADRSLGFRWFFSFLLFTQYRGFRGGATHKRILFLFDEPASNLHSSAQSQLLESFGRFPENSAFMYTTHSHHLINPEWLEGAFVVKNSGLSYDATDDDFDAANTRITLHKYREFVATHPDQTTYFQPILDVLDYRPSRLEKVPNVLMLEGKNDFYTLKYVTQHETFKKIRFDLLPGGGSGSLDAVIQLYLAWGRNFTVLLDSDNEGRGQKTRYREKFGKIVDDKIFDLSDINSSWANTEMEHLFSASERMSIQVSAYPSTSGYNKTHFNRAVQEAFLTNAIVPLSSETLSNFEQIVKFFTIRLANKT